MEEDVSSSQLDLYIQCNLSIPAGYSVDIDKVIIKFLWITHIVKQLYSNKDVKKKPKNFFLRRNWNKGSNTHNGTVNSDEKCKGKEPGLYFLCMVLNLI